MKPMQATKMTLLIKKAINTNIVYKVKFGMNAPTNATANINKLDTTNGFLLPILSAIGPDSNDPTKYPSF